MDSWPTPAAARLPVGVAPGPTRVRGSANFRCHRRCPDGHTTELRVRPGQVSGTRKPVAP